MVTNGEMRPAILGVRQLAAKVVSNCNPTFCYQSASISAVLDTIKGMIDIFRNWVTIIQIVDLATNPVLDVPLVYPTNSRMVVFITTFITITKIVSNIGRSFNFYISQFASSHALYYAVKLD